MSLTMLDKLEIAVSVDSPGSLMLLHAHQEEKILYVAFGTNLLIAVFDKSRFSKFRMLENISQASVTFAAVANHGKKVLLYCPQSESLQFVLFESGNTNSQALYPSNLAVCV
jgi:hypothetical protein